MLKKILIGLAFVILAFVVVVALQPSEYRVERSATMQAPPSEVFAQVNDFHKWEAWSPWAKLDPASKVTFTGPEAGTGAVMNWAGNEKVGKGTLTLVESKPDESVKTKVEFVEPFEGSANSEFNFTPAGDQTKVTWSMSGQHNFIEKAMCLVLNGKKMMADDIDKGLANMKSVVEQGNKS
jgi:hypothetical protein